MQIAEALHLSLQEVRALPASEITSWTAYFKIKNEANQPKKESEASQFKKMMGG